MNLLNPSIVDYNKRFISFILKERYRFGGSKPWSSGYLEARDEFIERTINSRLLLKRFRNNLQLPNKFGHSFDERVVEYPWIISNISGKNKTILDAGSTMNHLFLLQNRILNKHSWLIATLDVENNFFNDLGVSYLYDGYADLRNLCLKENTFDYVISCSVLEHIGMDNTNIYTNDRKYAEKSTNDYLKVIDEFKRVLSKGGECFITVPYGKYQNFGWFQQFDREMIKKVIDKFNYKYKEQFYKYSSEGWKSVSKDECDDCEYINPGVSNKIRQAAAGAVACLQFIKNE
ncbi:MAG: hypothetical protein UT08_C0001G0019 [Candidatus Woesebacteria bacterium GW2011_GWB1_38_8]|uniref:Methyltransferase type 11 domain-containing protein n=1 Tax=Candidatus Woesebacteria bacterium GW2011_GWB1_38_8 TaxID=1618570 RepID=A0A0G0L2G9_9BACT|nr:MAG: hypothetical protein UT08_C0001G0019 [Candidatus Woesebacteria bacterium GW2011_GWB1_38_8]